MVGSHNAWWPLAFILFIPVAACGPLESGNDLDDAELQQSAMALTADAGARTADAGARYIAYRHFNYVDARSTRAANINVCNCSGEIAGRIAEGGGSSPSEQNLAAPVDIAGMTFERSATSGTGWRLSFNNRFLPFPTARPLCTSFGDAMGAVDSTPCRHTCKVSAMIAESTLPSLLKRFTIERRADVVGACFPINIATFFKQRTAYTAKAKARAQTEPAYRELLTAVSKRSRGLELTDYIDPVGDALAPMEDRQSDGAAPIMAVKGLNERTGEIEWSPELNLTVFNRGTGSPLIVSAISPAPWAGLTGGAMRCACSAGSSCLAGVLSKAVILPGGSCQWNLKDWLYPLAGKVSIAINHNDPRRARPALFSALVTAAQPKALVPVVPPAPPKPVVAPKPVVVPKSVLRSAPPKKVVKSVPARTAVKQPTPKPVVTKAPPKPVVKQVPAKTAVKQPTPKPVMKQPTPKPAVKKLPAKSPAAVTPKSRACIVDSDCGAGLACKAGACQPSKQAPAPVKPSKIAPLIGCDPRMVPKFGGYCG